MILRREIQRIQLSAQYGKKQNVNVRLEVVGDMEVPRSAHLCTYSISNISSRFYFPLMIMVNLHCM